MQQHANARLGLSGRYALAGTIEGGMSLKAAAAAFSDSPATAHRWWHGWQEGERQAKAALCDRSSRPHRQPRRLSAAEEEPILRARRETGYGPGRLAGTVRRARSTVWKVLARHGLSRRPRPQAASPRRYEWSRPGALLHIDVKKLARFRRPGDRVTGGSARDCGQPRRRVRLPPLRRRRPRASASSLCAIRTASPQPRSHRDRRPAVAAETRA